MKINHLIVTLTLFVLASVLTAPLGRAATTIISVNFQGANTAGALSSSEITGAGTYAAANWNNVAGGGSAPLLTLNDSTGAATSVILNSFVGAAGGPETDNATPTKKLFGGSIWADQFNLPSGQVSFTLGGLSSFSSYDLVLYFRSGTSNRTGDFTVSGTSTKYYFSSLTSTTTFTQSDSTTPGSYASGNYVVFSGLTAATEIVTMELNNAVGLAGFQIVGTAVPEPSTWILLGLGGFGLLFARVRRQAALA